MGVVKIVECLDGHRSPSGIVGSLASESICGCCGYFPYIPSSQTRMLRDFLNKDKTGEYGHLLQTLGIILDKHLRILMGMNREDREAFFAQYVPSRLSNLGYIELTQTLDVFVDSHKWAPLSVTLIPRKGEAFEQFLSRPSTCSKLAAQSMRLSKGEYDLLAARIKLRIFWYLDIHRSFEEQTPGQIQAMLKVIRADSPLFDRYEDGWPIFVFIKRILATLPGSFHPSPDSPDSSWQPQCQRSQDIDSECNDPNLVQRQHRCPRLAQYFNSGGPKHVSPKARSMLSFLQMEEELCPALFFLGIQNDTRFDTVRRMKPERKAQLIGHANELELTAIQRLVLYMIFDDTP
ncbi:hypothetical protein FB451DRAFT_1206205 [Mycena latifolia]|nr:hypothetical protein FB451DRAFT_1206205 [Mycena latifolia]